LFSLTFIESTKSRSNKRGRAFSPVDFLQEINMKNATTRIIYFFIKLITSLANCHILYHHLLLVRDSANLEHHFISILRIQMDLQTSRIQYYCLTAPAAPLQNFPRPYLVRQGLKSSYFLIKLIFKS
jgi:hypothetical protein